MRFHLSGLVVGTSVAVLAAAPLTESTFTEVIRDVNVVAASTKSATPARTNVVFKVPDLVRTGSDSRVEMAAPDQTVTRIGANTVFTFESGERNIRLEKGSILFHAPAGSGGGTIKHRGTAAAVLGTTLICAVLPDRSFKTLVLEGGGKVTLANGRSVTLEAGEMVIVRPDGEEFSEVMVFSLGQLVARLMLIHGFSNPLASMSLIDAAIRRQNEQIATGKLGRFVSLRMAGYGLDLIPEIAPIVRPPIFRDGTTRPVSPS